MGVEEEGEVVANEVLATDAQVHRIPIPELTAHELQRLGRDGGAGGDLEEETERRSVKGRLGSFLQGGEGGGARMVGIGALKSRNGNGVDEGG